MIFVTELFYDSHITTHAIVIGFEVFQLIRYIFLFLRVSLNLCKVSIYWVVDYSKSTYVCWYQIRGLSNMFSCVLSNWIEVMFSTGILKCDTQLNSCFDLTTKTVKFSILLSYLFKNKLNSLLFFIFRVE